MSSAARIYRPDAGDDRPGPTAAELLALVEDLRRRVDDLADRLGRLAHLGRPGLSPIEARVLELLGGGPLLGKAIAIRLGERDGPKLKYLLRNMVERGLLDRDARNPGDGYRLAAGGKDGGA